MGKPWENTPPRRGGSASAPLGGPKVDHPPAACHGDTAMEDFRVLRDLCSLSINVNIYIYNMYIYIYTHMYVYIYIYMHNFLVTSL